MRPLRILQIVILVVLAAIGVSCFNFAVHSQKLDPPAREIVTSWNEAVATIEPEDQKFRELLDSYKRNPPGRVLLTPDVRAEQRKRRLKLIAEIIDSHETRIQAMKRLAKAEEASQ